MRELLLTVKFLHVGDQARHDLYTDELCDQLDISPEVFKLFKNIIMDSAVAGAKIAVNEINQNNQVKKVKKGK